jgi:hypothetical protein
MEKMLLISMSKLEGDPKKALQVRGPGSKPPVISTASSNKSHIVQNPQFKANIAFMKNRLYNLDKERYSYDRIFQLDQMIIDEYLSHFALTEKLPICPCQRFPVDDVANLKANFQYYNYITHSPGDGKVHVWLDKKPYYDTYWEQWLCSGDELKPQFASVQVNDIKEVFPDIYKTLISMKAQNSILTIKKQDD